MNQKIIKHKNINCNLNINTTNLVIRRAIKINLNYLLKVNILSFFTNTLLVYLLG